MAAPESSPCQGPFAGVRVIDFARVLTGPAASLALADLGAEVFKIGPPGTGDETRKFPPVRDGESHYYLAVNRGKKSIVVDLESDDGICGCVATVAMPSTWWRSVAKAPGVLPQLRCPAHGRERRAAARRGLPETTRTALGIERPVIRTAGFFRATAHTGAVTLIDGAHPCAPSFGRPAVV